MLPSERHDRIRSLVSAFQHLSTARIASELGVSRETVRRDVLALEEKGYVRRVFGGVAAPDDEAEAPIERRAQVRLREKRHIARAAVTLLKPGQTLFVDAGSTVAALADELSRLAGLTIITNSLDVALRCSGTTARALGAHDIVLLGGRPRAGLQATYGDVTVGQIYRYHADYAFVSPVGLHAEQGASSYDRAEAEVARAMCHQARQVVILADHSKLGQISRVQFCALDALDIVVTDAMADQQSGAQALAQRVRRWIVA